MYSKWLTYFNLKPTLFVALAFFLSFIQACGSEKIPKKEQIQLLPMKELRLDSFKDFQPIEDNWRISGDVRSNHEVKGDLHALDGTGILANDPSKKNNGHLFTKFTHSDLDLEMDFLIPKDSNSGIYLMGRYEVQLLDSWGVRDPQFSDVGGIYQRWDDSRDEGNKGYEGHPPAMNMARAPGLWQHLKIKFKAPEFDETGDKVSNARFEEVWLNGELIQEEVDVTGPTRASAFNDEQPRGPLMIQGDHGPVAVRNIKYKEYDKKEIALNNLTYHYFDQDFDQLPDFSSLEAVETESADSLSVNIVNHDDRYALRYNGTIQAPNSGQYLFKLNNTGMVRMLIDGNIIFEQDTLYRMDQPTTQTVNLSRGSHDFILEYMSNLNIGYSGLSLEAEGPRLQLQRLNAQSSVPGSNRELPELMVNPKDHVKIIRSFKTFGDSKRTHVVNVGSPNEINYSYDMGQAALLDTWEGPFLNANKMWIGRGEPQTATPGSSPLIFNGSPPIALLSTKAKVWPDSLTWNTLRVEGYSILENGWPVFEYSVNDVTIKEKIEGYADPRHLTFTAEFSAPSSIENFWFQLASGDRIIQEGENKYTIDDRKFYVKVNDTNGIKPQIIQGQDKHSLRLPVLNKSNKTMIEYEIIW